MSIKKLQNKWKYHRDCYMRAKKKIKQYVPSGSSASSANLKSSYRFFEIMRPLDDTFQTTPYVLLYKITYIYILYNIINILQNNKHIIDN
jgi:hypothetical protein